MPESDVEAVWRQHEAVVESVINRNLPLGTEGFPQALVFFEQLTGIEGSWDGTYFGVMPGPEIAESLAKWRSWYADNKERLRYNRELGRIEVKVKVNIDSGTTE